MRFVIVTGMSGSGKTTALKMLEDAGYYCVDNIPLPLVEKFFELITMPENEIEKIVLGLDVRADLHFEEAHEILNSLKQKGYPLEILFLDSDDNSLIKRYKETRRLHPLAPYGRVAEGVRREREILEELRKDADYVLDTTNLLTRELKAELDRIFVQNESYNSLMITITSFGFKYGIPQDSDLVFDVRFLPNPYYVDGLRSKTGNEKEIQDFVLGFPEAGVFLDKLTDMVKFLIPNYVKEGKYRLVIAIGCTGGKHRSVTLANALYERLKDQGNYGIRLDHKDIDKKRG